MQCKQKCCSYNETWKYECVDAHVSWWITCNRALLSCSVSNTIALPLVYFKRGKVFKSLVRISKPCQKPLTAFPVFYTFCCSALWKGNNGLKMFCWHKGRWHFNRSPTTQLKNRAQALIHAYHKLKTCITHLLSIYHIERNNSRQCALFVWPF